MSYASTDEPERSDGVAPPAPTLVVGIGASSGGLEALRSFCSALPRETGLAFVIIQHLDDSAPNLLPELLSNLCGIPAEEASDGKTLAADHIYVAPAHSIVRLHGGVFEAVKATTPEERRGLIDVFFHSLADDRQAGAIGVILSGSGTDGALGLKA
ncbi:MAG: chemotaxis protein CheB, partial [Isosphaeraceae bacterium]